ncbi:unnamed protein product [Kuraishia capsulata CBS 1993]|uniref:Endoplasmic reticulum transmembrane protein n=1 Tax=Kuraishia capsulata CBS 1993 TaxID=1382522 RepID=W6MSB2_9ASCO|nr:uncharacterized protein KUCA_T00000666001 [Kuraishia capsulata CBS 1993]CDK24700.1 unnamed protein product [Kuraishia capsulata CBS 1993]
MVLFAALSFPLPGRAKKQVLKTLRTPFRSQQVQIAIKCILGFILVLFLDALNRVYRVGNELDMLSVSGDSATAGVAAAMGMGDRSEIQARRFYAQRNMYLCGFTLFLTLILTRTYALVFELISVKEELKATDGKSKLDSLDSADKDEVAKLQKELAEKTETIEILKSQAANLTEDYDAVTQEVKSRETK